MEEALKLATSFQLFAANFYPPCPQPDQAIGLPPHTDYGLLTFLIHNGVPGLQIEHNGKWFNTNSPQNAILVNTADQLEVDHFFLKRLFLLYLLHHNLVKNEYNFLE